LAQGFKSLSPIRHQARALGMALVDAAASSPTCIFTEQRSAPSHLVFVNDDACGDWVMPFPAGPAGLSMQCVNAASALLFVAAGAHVLRRTEAPIARAYGLLMCGVGVGSFSFHATSSLSGFMIDIVPMAATAALMCFRAVHALQADAGQSGPEAETSRLLISAGAALVAVYVPWFMMVLGASHFAVWGVWALLFGSIGAFFGVVSLVVFFNEEVLHRRCGLDLGIAIACVLLGLGCTVHSFLPGLCDGWRTAFPLHAAWHLFSSVTANRCGLILDMLTKVVEDMENPETKGRTRNSLLVRLMKRDALPSQFSM